MSRICPHDNLLCGQISPHDRFFSTVVPVTKHSHTHPKIMCFCCISGFSSLCVSLMIVLTAFFVLYLCVFVIVIVISECVVIDVCGRLLNEKTPPCPWPLFYLLDKGPPSILVYTCVQNIPTAIGVTYRVFLLTGTP